MRRRFWETVGTMGTAMAIAGCLAFVICMGATCVVGMQIAEVVMFAGIGLAFIGTEESIA